MPWYNILSEGERDQNIEIARSINRFYDLNGYHTPTGPGSEAQRTPHTTGGGPDLSRGFAFVDSMTRGAGAHHQKVSFIRNRYGNFAFLGGIDLTPGRWDTNLHKSPENRKPGKEDETTHELITQGWHDVHAMLEGPVVLDVAINFFQTMECLCRRPARRRRISGRYLGGYPNSGASKCPRRRSASVARPRFRPGDRGSY